MTDVPLAHLSPRPNETPSLGFVAKAFAGLGSLASGLGASALYVNKQLFGNIAHALLATADSQLEAGMTWFSSITRNNARGSQQGHVQEFLTSLPAPNPNEHVLQHQQAVRSQLRNADTVLGKAMRNASSSPDGQRALQNISFNRTAQQKYWEFVQRHPEAERRANPVIHQEYADRRLAYDVGTLIDLEAREKLAKETVTHVPWYKKVALSGIQLTKWQKIGTGVVFATVTGVAALGFYRVLHKFGDKQKVDSPQR